ncbi:MAG: histidine kinase [Bacteroidota bacterium]
MFLFCVVVYATGQQADVTSYQQLVMRARAQETMNPDSVVYYAYQAYQLDSLRSEAFYWLGVGLRLKQEYDSALFWYKKYQSTASNAMDRGNAYMGIGGINYGKRKYEMALQNFREAMMIFKKEKNLERYAAALTNVAIISGISGNEEKAKAQYLEVLTIFQELDLPRRTLPALVNLASIYENQQQYDSAILFARKCYEISDSLNLPYGKGQAIKSLAPALIKSGRPQSGLRMARDGIEIFKRLNVESAISSLRMNEAQALFSLGSRNEAIQTAETLLQDSSVFKEDLFEFLAMAYQSLGDYKTALQYQESYQAAYEREERERNLQLLNQLEAKYESSQKALEISQLESELQLEQANASRRKWTIFSLFILGTSFTIALWSFYQKRLSLAKARSIVQEQQLLRSQMNPHFLFNVLASIQDFIIDNKAREAVKYLASFGSLVRDILDSTRQDFIPLAKEIAMLENFVKLESLRFLKQVDLRVQFAEEVTPEACFIPPMLIQPFVENAIKHGFSEEKGGSIHLSFQPEGNYILVTILDDGKGLPTDFAPFRRDVHAVQITKERLASLWKKSLNEVFFQIANRTDGPGVSVSFQIPFRYSTQ